MKKVATILLVIVIALILKDFYLLVTGGTFTWLGLGGFIVKVIIGCELEDSLRGLYEKNTKRYSVRTLN